MRNMNNLQKTITIVFEELGAVPGISEADMRAVVRKLMTDLKAAHRTKK